MNEPEAIKVVLVGESGVGKTSIISQFTTHKFDPHRETSLSAQFVSKTLDFPEIGNQLNLIYRILWAKKNIVNWQKYFIEMLE